MSGEGEVDEGRRRFIKAVGLASGFIALGGVTAVLKAVKGPITVPPWPRVRVANIADLKTGGDFSFNYPLETTPNLVLKLGRGVEGGVGPDGDIVAFSQICQHMGCTVQWKAERGRIECPCHAAFYDPLEGAKVVGGPSLYPLPRVKLEYEASTGDIYAVGMGPPVVFGYGPPGSDDVDIVLIGGKLVSG